LDSPNLWMAIRFKTNSVRGGTIEKIYIRNLTVGRVRDAIIHATMYYSPGVPQEGDIGNYTPVIRDIDIRNVTSQSSKWAVFLQGYERSPIQNVYIGKCVFNNVTLPNFYENTKNINLVETFINGERAH
jgi:hypothetical protein